MDYRLCCVLATEGIDASLARDHEKLFMCSKHAVRRALNLGAPCKLRRFVRLWNPNSRHLARSTGVESGPGFDVYFQLGRQVPQPAERSGKGIRILVAEDNPINQEIALAILESAGIFIEIASNGKEAVEAVYRMNFDAVLMDIQMPEMDGYEATKIIRRDSKFKSLPIIAMTAHAMKGDEEKCIEAGMDGYISKPINDESLIKIIEQHLAKQKSKPD